MSEAERKTCASCQVSFVIEPEDFAFYAKMQVPPPTWCPDCRAQRRMAWRNEWHLFKRPDARTGELIFSSLSPQSLVQTYDTPDWFSDAWDPKDFGRAYDFSRPFFAQLKDLLYSVPLPGRSIAQSENSDYSMNATGLRNCYLVRAANFTEDSAYLVWDNGSRNCLDCHMTTSCELCYDGLNLTNCYRTFYSVDCEGCRDVYLSKNCVGSSNLFGCMNLRNKQYCIWNKQYTKEEYEQQLADFDLESHQAVEELRDKAQVFWLTQPQPHLYGSSNEGVSGEYVSESKNAHQVYRMRSAEDVKYSHNLFGQTSHDCYDYTNFGEGAEYMYECLASGFQAHNLKFCWFCWMNVSDLEYSMICLSSSNLFGCVGMRKQQYCILNKQYTKEEYEALVPKIIQHMQDMPYVDANGRSYGYGEFFPADLCPTEYNISAAQEFFPLTRQEAEQQGRGWYESADRETRIDIPATDFPDRATQQAAISLLGKVIGCEHDGSCAEECSKTFTVIPQEIAFLLEQGLPLPRLCPNCRHASRIEQRRGLTLSERPCQCAGVTSTNGVYHNISSDHHSHTAGEPCPTTFQTSLVENQPDIVYCETCYQAEIV